ncbi:MAG: hypothetical protein KF693_06465 [Nitrospira sp.]|nr:hypothetical protein [Nitrospira sp.]
MARHILQPYSRSTLVERLLIFTTIVALPLQDYFPPVAGMSISFLFFATLAAYVIVNRLRSLGAVWYHPVFIAAYAFIVVNTLLEFSSPLSRYGQIIQFAQMTIGAICVAALCRDRLALGAGLYGFIATGLWVGIILFSTSYGTLQEMGAGDFSEASKLRAEAFEDKPMAANINALAMWCALGAIVAFALCLSDRLKHFRVLLVGIASFCFVASFLPMSRGAAAASLMSFAVILYAHGVRQGKALILASIIGMGIYAVVPDAVWSRMAFSTSVQEDGKMESRAKLYAKAFNRLPEYIVAGVGAGNFYNKWAFEKGFSKTIAGVVVPFPLHNSFLQITVFWGVFGLLMFLMIIWCVYRSIPLRCGRDEFSLALLGIIVSLGALLMQTHNFHDKLYALGIGMVVGARQWIWPRGIVSEVEVSKRPLGDDINRSQDRYS